MDKSVTQVEMEMTVIKKIIVPGRIKKKMLKGMTLNLFNFVQNLLITALSSS